MCIPIQQYFSPVCVNAAVVLYVSIRLIKVMQCNHKPKLDRSKCIEVSGLRRLYRGLFRISPLLKHCSFSEHSGTKQSRGVRSVTGRKGKRGVYFSSYNLCPCRGLMAEQTAGHGFVLPCQFGEIWASSYVPSVTDTLCRLVY